jgi:GTP cyclohydrolase I
MINQKGVERAIEAFLAAIGEVPSREGLRETPQRVARMCAELFGGNGVDPVEAIDAMFDFPQGDLECDENGELVILRDVPFFSTCEHHLLPFFGRAHMGYVPNGRIAGASKLARALEVVARQLQIQERMTRQLADTLYRALDADGVAIITEAEHMCMVARGVRAEGSRVVTTATRGPFARGVTTPSDFLALLQRR